MFADLRATTTIFDETEVDTGAEPLAYTARAAWFEAPFAEWSQDGQLEPIQADAARGDKRGFARSATFVFCTVPAVRQQWWATSRGATSEAALLLQPPSHRITA